MTSRGTDATPPANGPVLRRQARQAGPPRSPQSGQPPRQSEMIPRLVQLARHPAACRSQCGDLRRNRECFEAFKRHIQRFIRRPWRQRLSRKPRSQFPRGTVTQSDRCGQLSLGRPVPDANPLRSPHNRSATITASAITEPTTPNSASCRAPCPLKLAAPRRNSPALRISQMKGEGGRSRRPWNLDLSGVLIPGRNRSVHWEELREHIEQLDQPSHDMVSPYQNRPTRCARLAEPSP